jgi:hypothetical protein
VAKANSSGGKINKDIGYVGDIGAVAADISGEVQCIRIS